MKRRLIFLLVAYFNTLFGTPLQPPLELYKNYYKIDKHPGFAPYISHVDFRKCADFVIDQSTELFDPDLVKQGDIIFLNLLYLPWFEQHVHDHIKYPYILLSYDTFPDSDRIPKAGTCN